MMNIYRKLETVGLIKALALALKPELFPEMIDIIMNWSRLMMIIIMYISSVLFVFSGGTLQ